MDPGAAYGGVIAIVGIVMGVGAGMMKMWTRHQQEMARIRTTAQVVVSDAARSEFEALRTELSSLRNTTTQYDMSVENALTEIKQRLSTVETKTQTPYKAVQDEQPKQNVGLGSER